jgi:hypothetical protein
VRGRTGLDVGELLPTPARLRAERGELLRDADAFAAKHGPLPEAIAAALAEAHAAALAPPPPPPPPPPTTTTAALQRQASPAKRPRHDAAQQRVN